MTKKLLVSVLFVYLVFVITGCRGFDGNESGGISAKGELPVFLAGTWQEEESHWKIVLTPDGTVSSAVIPLGTVEIKPNQTTEVQGWGGEPGIFEAGEFEVYYDPDDHELSVIIELKHVYLEMGGILDGTCEYLIIGSVSEDGQTWYADLYTTLDLTVLMPEPNSVGEEPAFKKYGVLRADLNDGAERLIFTKAEIAPDKNEN